MILGHLCFLNSEQTSVVLVFTLIFLLSFRDFAFGFIDSRLACENPGTCSKL